MQRSSCHPNALWLVNHVCFMTRLHISNVHSLCILFNSWHRGQPSAFKSHETDEAKPELHDANAHRPVHSDKLHKECAGYHFLFAFNSFHIMLSVWVTGGRTFQGLSPCFHVRLSKFDWDPLSLQERGCSQVAWCCLPVLKVRSVCRASEEK